MSGNQWSGDVDYDEDGTEEPEGINQLRKQYRAVQKANKEMEAELTKLRVQSRTSSVAELLKARNVNPKVAALVPGNVEPTEEGIAGWLEEYGEIFNVKGSAPNGGGPVPEDRRAEPALSADDVTALNKVAAASQGATVDTSKVQELLGQVQSAKTPEEFYALMQQHGVGRNVAGG